MTSEYTPQTFQPLPDLYRDKFADTKNGNYAVVTFIPSPDAKPDKDGSYGFQIIRGVFHTISDAHEFSEETIRRGSKFTNFIIDIGKHYPFTCNKTDYVDPKDLIFVKAAKDAENALSKKDKEEIERQRAEMEEAANTLKESIENFNQDFDDAVQALKKFASWKDWILDGKARLCSIIASYKNSLRALEEKCGKDFATQKIFEDARLHINQEIETLYPLGSESTGANMKKIIMDRRAVMENPHEFLEQINSQDFYLEIYKTVVESKTSELKTTKINTIEIDEIVKEEEHKVVTTDGVTDNIKDNLKDNINEAAKEVVDNILKTIENNQTQE